MELEIEQEQTKRSSYQTLISQIEALVQGEDDLIANLANIAAVIKSTFGFFWVGFYRFDGKELVLGPFQGPVACTRIQIDRGVCGKAYRDKESILVPDVHAFQDHIACSPESQSEIVVPIFQGNEVAMVLDIDSDELDTFTTVDQEQLEKIAHLIGSLL